MYFLRKLGTLLKAPKNLFEFELTEVYSCMNHSSKVSHG